jgi:nicotinate phosphoribosyltransferase
LTLPGRKQVFRAEADGAAAFDVIARSDEPAVGRPLLRDVMHLGKRLALAGMTLNDARARKEAEVARLPERLRAIPPADPPYDVRISTSLIEDTEHLRRQYEQTTAPAHPARTRSA